MTTTRLDPEYRRAALRRLAEDEFDVLVIGGGVVGAGAALDAASRGLSVALVEARDLAAGTSSRSSKLIHGGLRYLEQKDFALVREALKERGLLLNRLAPHLVRPVPFLLPLTQWWERAYIGAGVLLYDTMGGGRSVPWHRQLSKRRALKLAPSLKSDALVGAIQYYDAQVDDARHTMMIARTAAQHGAEILTRTRALALCKDGGRVTGAEVEDLQSGERITVRARQVISATGVWTDELYAAAGVDAPFHVRASKGVHIVVPRERISLDTAMILRTEKSVLFVIPWGRHWIIGTTDTDWTLDKAHPAASKADVDYVLDHVNAVLERPITHEDIEGVYAGLRPLLAGASAQTAKLSREHAVAQPAPGLTVIAGGKYTTYRVMAKDAVDAAASGLDGGVPGSRTERLPIYGAVGFREMWADRAAVARAHGLTVAQTEHLLRRYGSGVRELFALLRTQPELARPLAGAPEYLRAEAVYAASHEGALHLEDVLTRRTRISIEQTDRGVAAAEEVAGLVGPVLGWDAAQTAREVALYRARVDAERAAQEAADDQAANASRLAAPDLFALPA
ncbi:MAG TPA: glycerol-3-phosphate dehydrogenase/oxidase [Pseudonocardiaceae bacterium]|nr:glycerol-3-phosphate dehydrogenase/oxidase [Pseudonocardiaceae bacterium]